MKPDTERFARTSRLIGLDGLDQLSHSLVLVVGLGAVGSYAVEALARAGVGRFRLVDFDRIQTTNINRQLYALESTMGLPKVQVARDRIRDINPNCIVDTLECFAHTETLDQILAGQVDLVIDAIDSLAPKLTLIESTYQRNIPLVSSMGAALRRDPCAVRAAKLSKTKHCPLARQIRKKLRNRNCPANPDCVYSVEHVDDLPENAIADIESSDDNAIDRGRKRRTLGSMPTVTGVFGLVAAHIALQILTHKPPK